MASKEEIIKIMAVMAKAYPNYAPKEGTAELYHMILEDIPYDALQAGAKSYLTTNNAFFPTPGQWRQLSLDISMAKSNIPSAIEAWGEVLRAFDNYGSYREPKFTHPLITNIVCQMGWQNLCLSENQVADRARFLQAYEASITAQTSEVRMLPSVRTVAEKYQIEQSNSMIKQLTEGMAK
jgi:hypothetical protein